MTEETKQAIPTYLTTNMWTVDDSLPGIESTASLRLSYKNSAHIRESGEIERFLCKTYGIMHGSVSFTLTSAQRSAIVNVHGDENIRKMIAGGVPMRPTASSTRHLKANTIV